MRHAVVKNGVVVNVVLADEVTGRANGWIPTDEADISWVHDGVNFLRPAPNLEVMAQTAREIRDALLLKSDVMVLPDRWAAMTLEHQQAWAQYRQMLRDLPTQEGFPSVVVWPQKPE